MKKVPVSVFFIVMLLIFGIAFVAAFGITSSYGDITTVSVKGAPSIRTGIDIRGGIEASFEPITENTPTKTQVDAAKQIIELRLDAKNIADREVLPDYSNGRIIVRFPWQSGETNFDPEVAIQELGASATLTFRNEAGETFMTGDDVSRASASYDETRGYFVSLELKDSGKSKFATATAEAAANDTKISIYMDDQNVSTAGCDEAITTGSAVIEGDGFTAESVSELADTINAGALPFELKSQDYNTISPTLGEGALDITIKAALLGFILVCLFMLFYYRIPGLVSCIALIGQVSGAVLAVSLSQFTLTLPGIAGIILSIGMGLDANIITSERIREEVRAGRTVKSAINAGYDNSWSAILDGNVTVLIVAVILYMLGSGSVKSFGFTLGFGVLFNFIMGVWASQLMQKGLSNFKFLRNPWLYGARKKGSGVKEAKTFKLYDKRKALIGVAAGLVAACVVCSFIFGIKLDVDFSGGTIMKYTYQNEIDTNLVGTTVEGAIGRGCEVSLSSDTTGKNFVTVTLAGNDGITPEEKTAIDTALTKALPDNNVETAETSNVAANLGTEFLITQIIAVVISAVLMVLYIWWRFRKIGGLSAGAFALVALLIDVTMCFLAFIIFGIALDDNCVAVILTILGYSINATIVIFDRVRENERSLSKNYKIEAIVDKSVTQSFGRCLFTSLCTFAVIAILAVFALANDLQSLISFAVPMMFGIASGFFTSTFISGPLWATWMAHKRNKAEAIAE